MEGNILIGLGVATLGFALWIGDHGATFFPAAIMCAACGFMLLNMGIKLRGVGK